MTLSLAVPWAASKMSCKPTPRLGMGRGEADALPFSSEPRKCCFWMKSHILDSPMELLRGLE